MSKIGSKPIIIPEAVTVNIDDQTVFVKGKEGELKIEVPKVIKIVRQGNQLVVTTSTDHKKSRSLHGLYRQLIANAVTGVEKPWTKKLEVVGTGYNVKPQGEDVVFKLGYSHPVVFKKIPGIKFITEDNNKLTVIGVDKQLVGEIASKIKTIKKPDSYKGKGIRYVGEKIRLKPSKKVKATGEGAG